MCIFVTKVHFSTSDTHTTCVRIIYVCFKYTDASDALLRKVFFWEEAEGHEILLFSSDDFYIH